MTSEQLTKEIESWNSFFSKRFIPVYYGVFKKHGISQDTALLAYVINILNNDLCEVIAEDKENNNGFDQST